MNRNQYILKMKSKKAKTRETDGINEELVGTESDGSSSDDDGPEVRFLSVHEAIEEAGGFGKFQFLYVPLAGIGFISNGFFVYNLNYLTLLPELLCPDGQGGMRSWIDESTHRRDNFWTSDGKLESFVQIDYGSYRTLTNWMSDMNMYWSSSLEVSLFGSIFFFGVLFWAIGLRFANIYGRKPVLILGWIISLLLSIGLVFINNAIARYVMMFVYGVWFFRNIQGYILSTELSPKRLQLLVWSVIFALDLIEVAFLSIYFMFISKNYIYFFYGAIAGTVIMTICSFFVPESPIFLYEKGKWEQARNLINRMARMNGSKLANDQWVLDKEEILGYAPMGNQEMMIAVDTKNSNDNTRIRNTLKPIGKGGLALATSGDLSPPTPDNPIQMMRQYPQIFLNMIVLTTWWISISFNKYLIAFNLKHLPGNIFINAGISPIADMIGHMLCIVVQKYTSTKITFMGSFALSFIFGFALIFISTSWLVPILIVFAKIGLASGYSLCYYITKIFRCKNN